MMVEKLPCTIPLALFNSADEVLVVDDGLSSASAGTHEADAARRVVCWYGDFGACGLRAYR